jgi:hypothetical protein
VQVHPLIAPLAAAVAGALAGTVVLAATGPLVALVVGIVVAALAYGLVAGARALAVRNRPTPAELLPRPAKGSPADVWLGRAEKAVRTLTGQVRSAGTVRESLTGIAAGAGATLDELRRVAAQVAAVDDAAGAIDVARLQAERTRLVQTVYDTPERSAARAGHTRAAAAVAEQLATYQRLRSARDELVARLESTALGLEGLVARAADIVALAAAAGAADTTTARVGELTEQLDGLRGGLAEADALSRRVLGS